jgi:hypothetical protein
MPVSRYRIKFYTISLALVLKGIKRLGLFDRRDLGRTRPRLRANPNLDSKGFWRWFIALGITDFFFQIYLSSGILNWICFCPQLRGWETPTILGPLEKTNFRHWVGRMASDCGEPGLMPEEFLSHWWWTKWHQEVFLQFVRLSSANNHSTIAPFSSITARWSLR